MYKKIEKQYKIQHFSILSDYIMNKKLFGKNYSLKVSKKEIAGILS